MNTQLKALAFVLSLTAVGQAGARTWTVEQSGSGDWLTIQPAVDAAASGDTILIGAGRYDQLHAAPLASTAIGFWETPKSLVFIGSAVDSVIIGPTSYIDDSYGFWVRNMANQTFIRLTFTNLYRGIASGGTLNIDACNFIGCALGVNSLGIAGVSTATIRNSVFEGRVWGFSSYSMNMRDAAFALVENCNITDMELYLQGMTDSMVRNCIFTNRNYDVAVYHYMSNGAMEGNEVTGRLAVGGMSTIALRNNVCYESASALYPRASPYNLAIDDSRAIVQAYGNIFHGASNATLLLAYDSTLSGNGNHFLKGTGPYVVKLEQYPSARQVDLTNNYWGTTDAAEIASWIYDRNDDPVNIKGTVLFEPFSDIPLPVEKKSLGSFKAMFRDATR